MGSRARFPFLWLWLLFPFFLPAQDFPWDQKPGLENGSTRSEEERSLGLDPDGPPKTDLREVLGLQGELLNSLQDMYGMLSEALREAQTPHARLSPEELAEKAARVGLYNSQVAILSRQLPRLEKLQARLGGEISPEARQTIQRLSDAIDRSQAIVDETFRKLAEIYAKQGTPLPSPPPQSPPTSPGAALVPESRAEVQALIEAGGIESSVHLLEVFQRLPEAEIPKASLADFRRYSPATAGP